uniref:THAP-type domain-containing protein n=1 Tax=Xenopus tropicalis TaxID=8364 RepID=A0A803K6I4_XENTR
MPSCIVRGCPHKTGQKAKYPDVTLHTFPHKLDLIKNWLRQTGQYAEINHVAERILQDIKKTSYRMCSNHFTEDCFMNLGSKRGLKPNSIPTQFVHRKVTAVLTAQEPVTNIPAAKRRRVEEDPMPTTSTIVRIISRLVTVQTQTERKYFKNSSTITDISYSARGDQTIHNGDESTEAGEWRIPKDHLYPVASATRGKPRFLQKTTEMPSLFIRDTGTHHDEPNFDIESISDEENIHDETLDSTSEHDQKLHSSHFGHDSMLSRQVEDINQRKFLVFEEQLDKLFYLCRCQHSSSSLCQAPIIKINKKLDGTLLEVRLQCLEGHESLVWTSQPLAGQVSLGNVAMANAVLLSGSSFTKIKEFMEILGMPFYSPTIYRRYQRDYVFPSIDLAWKREKVNLLSEMSDRAVVLAGDGQFNSPGYSSQFCTYTMMDVSTKKVIAFSIDQVVPGKTSGQMEAVAFERCLDDVKDQGTDVKLIITDRQPAVRQLMLSKYKSIDHQYDVWRVCKNVAKRLSAASKTRNGKAIAPWVEAITKHLWWCSQTCYRNVDVLIDKWKSVLYHISNRHTFPALKHYNKCHHKTWTAAQSECKRWIPPGHPAHTILTKIITDPKLIKDISQIGKFCHTEELENFHSKAFKFRPKGMCLGVDSMHARTMLAVLSHNRNTGRWKATNHDPRKSRLEVRQEGIRTTYPKRKEDSVAKPIYEQVTDPHIFDIMSDSARIAKGQLLHRWESRC